MCAEGRGGKVYRTDPSSASRDFEREACARDAPPGIVTDVETHRGDILTDTSSTSLRRATIRNLMDFNRHVRLSPHADCGEAGGLFRWTTPIPHANYNGVVASSGPSDRASGHAASIVEFFRARGTPSVIWWIDADVEPDAWAPALLPLGFARGPDLPGMAVELAALPGEPGDADASGAMVRRVDGHAERRNWARTFPVGYGLRPEWAGAFFDVYASLDDRGGPARPLRSYVGYEEGVPVATSTLFLGAGVAGIYDVATIPEARGRGHGTAVTLAPLREARSLGYRIGILHASPMGHPMYERLGFRDVCRLEHFTWDA
jgi:GNAT superfamily N-acetyltransferase